jgi:hypothetical protein
MTDRLGHSLYWLGITVALVAIGFAVLWNGATYFALNDAEARFAAIKAVRDTLELKKADLVIEAIDRGMSQENAEWLTDRIILSRPISDNKADPKLISDALSRGVPEQDSDWLVSVMLELELVRHPAFTGDYEHFDNNFRVARESLDLSIFHGGIMGLVGLIAFAVGWTMQRILPQPD